VDRPGFFTTACFHTPADLAAEVDATGFAVYGVEGPGRPLRQESANGRRREQILSASRAAETEHVFEQRPPFGMSGLHAGPRERSAPDHPFCTAQLAVAEDAAAAPNGGSARVLFDFRSY